MTRRVCMPWIETWTQYGHDIFADGCRAVFEELGFEVDFVHRQDVEPWKYTKDDIMFFLDNQCASCVARHDGDTLATRVFFNMDPLRTRHIQYVQTFNYEVILDYNEVTTAKWAKAGHRRVAYCGQGYHEIYERHAYQGEDRFEDAIYMLTGPNPRRGRVLLPFAKKGIPLIQKDFRWDRQNTMKLAASPGVHLNVLRNNCLTFGWMRVVMFFGLGRAFMLSEELDWYPEGMEPGVHWDVCSWPDLPQRAAYWMKRPEERAQIGQACHDFLVENHRLDQQLPAALREVGLL